MSQGFRVSGVRVLGGRVSEWAFARTHTLGCLPHTHKHIHTRTRTRTHTHLVAAVDIRASLEQGDDGGLVVVVGSA